MNGVQLLRKFAVVIIQPPNYIHSLAFREIGLLLTASLRSLGKEADLYFNRFFTDKFNILLGYNLLSDGHIQQLKQLDCAIFQLEQMSDREGWFSERLLKALQAVDYVWDYSQENLSFLAKQGIKQTRLLSIGYHPDLEMIKPAKEDIDVLFYGSANERRLQIINKLKSECRTKVLFGVYGAERDQYIARAKIVLNIHYYEAQLMEQVRLSYLLNNGRFVISESSKNNPFDEAVVTAEYGGLVDTCLRYLSDNENRQQLAKKAYGAFKKHRMETHLANVLRKDRLL